MYVIVEEGDKECAGRRFISFIVFSDGLEGVCLSKNVPFPWEAI